MNKFLIGIYDFFERHRILMYSILGVWSVAMVVLALNVKFSEDITSFFPKGQQQTAKAFNNLKVKDKIIVMAHGRDTIESVDPYAIIESIDQFAEQLQQDQTVISSAVVTRMIDQDKISGVTSFIYDNLPILLTEQDYLRLDTLATASGAAKAMERNYNNLLSPSGGFISDFVYNDPLGLSFNALSQLQNLAVDIDYDIIDGYLFSKDHQTLFMFIDPIYGDNKNELNETLVNVIEQSIEDVNRQNPQIEIEYFGAPAVALYNARQIKQDVMLTMTIAMLVVVVFIFFAFRNKWNILLILTPVIFGGLFAFSAIYFIQGEMSAIAAGAGAVVFGIALSYSIHILSHSNHCKDPRQIIEELSYPLTVGSFTTIGAFLGLLFTDSKLLYDFGLFSSLTLIGTTIFSLIFLPHFISIGKDAEPNLLLRMTENLANKRWDKKYKLVALIAVITIVCSFYFRDVKFDSDMMNLNFEPPHLSRAEERLNKFSKHGDSSHSNVIFIASGDSAAASAQAYNELCDKLDQLKEQGQITSYSSINNFVLSRSEQQSRIARWKNFWTIQRSNEVIDQVDKAEKEYGFQKGTFSALERMITREYSVIDYNNAQTMAVFSDWVNTSPNSAIFIANVSLNETPKETIYKHFDQQSNIFAVDRSFYAGKMAESVNHNFYLILYISSFLIFFALMVSYGRIELTLISFLPMFISWIIILGLMAIFDIKFNIVSIILSSFIFGIGDDFSIFIMDGLQSDYRDKRKVLGSHKTAILFSAFTVIVGMGVLVFAKHPAIHSLAWISLFGIFAVVLVAFTIEPVIFNIFIGSQARKGGFPYTIMGLLNSVYAFGLFVVGCLFIQLYIAALWLVPVGKDRRKYYVHKAVSWSTHAFLRMMITTKMVNLNMVGETFSKPAVIIANHQSFIDILLLLGLYPKTVMVTNSWVWRSPFFGRIVRFLDFYHTADGYERLADSLEAKVAQGYSVIVFPEGTRSEDCTIGRFHKGAFYLAERLGLDILPVLIYGNGLVSSKNQPLFIKKGLLMSKILPRIKFGDNSFGDNYTERSKQIARWFRDQYDQMYEEFNRTSNSYFYDALIKNYIYKGPVLEWYIRIKVKMEGSYRLFDELLPRRGNIVDIGCGYGPMTLMLGMLSNKRTLLGIDYDQRKIELARNCSARSPRIEFSVGDIRNIELPRADAFVLSDVLHYVDADTQREIIRQCVEKLNVGGMIVVRDGDTVKSKRHRITKLTEKCSTSIFGFNKTDGDLCFFSSDDFVRMAQEELGLSVRMIDNDRHTSNTIYVMTK